MDTQALSQALTASKGFLISRHLFPRRTLVLGGLVFAASVLSGIVMIFWRESGFSFFTMPSSAAGRLEWYFRTLLTRCRAINPRRPGGRCWRFYPDIEWYSDGGANKLLDASPELSGCFVI